jgi:hypothetical protein
MTKMRPLLPFLLVSLVAAQEAAPNPIDPGVAQQIREEGIERSEVTRILRELTGEIGHRLTGSDNFTKACEWARSEFSAMGLSNVQLEKWGEWKLAWNRGDWSGRILSPVELDMYVATRAWTAGTNGPRKGAVVLLPEGDEPGEPEAAAARLAARVAGKWLITEVLPDSTVVEAMGAAGALGVVYRAGDPNKEFPTRVRVFGEHEAALGSLSDVPTTPEIAVRADHFDALYDHVQRGEETVCEFTIDNRFREGPIELHNVIAEIPGTEKPDEVVIVCAHLDSWHQAQGCTDNGTGTATTLEAARILAKVGVEPKRTIRFMLWGGEEQGLLGSIAYVRRHRAEMPKVSAVFNHDTGTNWAQWLGVTDAIAEQLAPVFENVTRLMQPPDEAWEGPVFSLRRVPRIAGGGGSDHASFLAAGVPGLDWGLKGRSNYFQHTWHTQWDTFDVAIEEYQKHTATVIAMAALGTANLDALLDRQNVGGDLRRQSEQFTAGLFEADLEGLTFKGVKEGGRAARMGVVEGDVLKAVDGREVRSTRRLWRLVRDSEGDSLKLTFQRGDSTFEVSLDKSELQSKVEAKPAAGDKAESGDKAAPSDQAAPRDKAEPAKGQSAPVDDGGERR